MKYLIYKQEGFNKKFLLEKMVIKVGRGENNDLVIDDELMSQEHLRITVGPDTVRVTDMGSENGFWIENCRQKGADIAVGDSFKAGDTLFFLREGDAEDFTLSKDDNANPAEAAPFPDKTAEAHRIDNNDGKDGKENKESISGIINGIKHLTNNKPKPTVQPPRETAISPVLPVPTEASVPTVPPVQQAAPQAPHQAPTTSKTFNDVEIIANSPKMKDLIGQAKKIAASGIFILIQGESGTGKELFARLIHNFSTRKDKQFIALNCAAIPENLLESELFGYEKGAFAGADTIKTGKLELASGGTLLLDEIGDIPLNLQAKLLRALQENEFYRLGGSIPIKVDLRIISLTRQNLEEAMEKKRFREDLYYRLVHRAITLPPLRERKEDIPTLINFFTAKFCSQRKRTISDYSTKAVEALENFDWRGNIRQLENEINSIINLTDDGETIDFDILSEKIKAHHQKETTTTTAPGNETAPLPAPDPQRKPPVFNKRPGLDEILEALEHHDWNKSRAANMLNMTYHGLHKKMKKLGIVRPE